MFGKHWEPATGIIVDSRIAGTAHSSSNDNSPATVHEYVVDVTPTDGPTFRAKVEQPTSSAVW